MFTWITLSLAVFLIALAFCTVVFRNRLSLRSKIVSLGLLIGLSSTLVVGVMATHSSITALEGATTDSLVAIRDGRKGQIEDYFLTIHEQMVNFSQNQMVVEATKNYTQAFHNVAEESGLATDNTSAVVKALHGYFDNEFQPRAKEGGTSYRGATTYIPENPNARILQAWYTANLDNPHYNVGDKLSLDRATQDVTYNRLHAQYHPQMRRFLLSFGYYDIFLFDTEGNLVYTCFKETDFTTNFLTGPYKDTNFGRAVRSALASSAPGQVFIEDFEPYEPSYGNAASFISAPVFDNGRLIGCAAFQMPVDKINGIMQQSAGLGQTGETYLVAADQRMRSNSRFAEEGKTTIFNQQVKTQAATNALQGQTGVVAGQDYAGEDVLAAYAPLAFTDAEGNPVEALKKGLEWSIIAEVNRDELAAPARALSMSIAVIGVGIALGVVLVTLVFAMAITRPIRSLITSIKTIIDSGDMRVRFNYKADDEIGALGKCFNQFAARIHDMVFEIKEAAQQVSKDADSISQVNCQVADSMREQTLKISQVSAAVEEVSSSVVEVARKSADAARSAGESGRVAEDGGKVVQSTIGGMRSIQDAVSKSADSVQQLGKLGEQIGAVITVINDIADQTNLLALNAAIEAARAGEHGRGFAVVADEVRKLADRTTKATEEIAGSITAIQVGTNDAVQQMEGGIDRVKEGMSHAEMAGASLSQIVTSAKDVSSMIQSIAAAAEQQSAASEEVARNVAEIAQVSDQTSASVQQASLSTQSLVLQADTLKQLIARFQVIAVDRRKSKEPAQTPGGVDRRFTQQSDR